MKFRFYSTAHKPTPDLIRTFAVDKELASIEEAMDILDTGDSMFDGEQMVAFIPIAVEHIPDQEG